MFANSSFTDVSKFLQLRDGKIDPQVTKSPAHAMKLKLLFFLRKEKTDVCTKTCPLYLRITVLNERTEVSLNREVHPDKWNKGKQCLKGTSLESIELNDFLKTVKLKIYELQRSLLEKGEIVTAKALKALLLNQDARNKTLIQVFDYHIANMRLKAKPAFASGYSLSTIKKYEYCRDHLRNFLFYSFGDRDLSLVKFNLEFIQKFYNYMLADLVFKDEQNRIVKKARNDNNAAMKNLQLLRKVIKEAEGHGWIKVNPFVSFRTKYDKTEQVYLTEEEVTRIAEKEIAIERLAIIRDIFIFCCFTGLAYSDVSKLNKSHIEVRIDKTKWLRISRTKTNTPCIIPILPNAQKILDKYSQNPLCLIKDALLPVPSNQKFNSYLKELASICNINKTLTCHSARRTFATIAMNNNIPAETIIKIIGHSGFSQLDRYSKVAESKIATDIQPLINKYATQ